MTSDTEAKKIKLTVEIEIPLKDGETVLTAAAKAAEVIENLKTYGEVTGSMTMGGRARFPI